MATFSKEEYLKRYLSENAEEKKTKKKRKKGSTSVAQKSKIIDDDIDFKSLLPSNLENTLEEDVGDNEPTIADFVDERPEHVKLLEKYKDSTRWKTLGTSEEHGSDSRRKRRYDSDSDQSPGRRRRHDSDSDQSPARRRRYDSDSDQSPARRKKSESSLTRKKRVVTDSDQSPAKKQKHISSKESSNLRTRDYNSSSMSSKRRGKQELGQERDRSKRKSRWEAVDKEEMQQNARIKRTGREMVNSGSPDQSNRHDHYSKSKQSSLKRSRKRQNSDSSETSICRQKHGSDSDHSPVRRHRRDSDSDQSPARNKRHDSDSDQSPVRRQRHGSDSDHSPVRRHRHDSDSDQSPVRRQRHDSYSDQSPPRTKQRTASSLKSERSKKSNSVDRNNRDKEDKMSKTLSGKRAGLSSAKAVREELETLRRKEDEAFGKISEDRLGKNSTTVFRDKSGRRRNLAAEKKEQEEEDKERKKQEKKYAEWGKGLKQQSDQQQTLTDHLHEMSKPLARFKDDEDLDRMMREMDREGDPMAAFIKKKKKKGKDGKPVKEKPKYSGPAPQPNRFGILPGYRWDGVDRSNGFEKALFAKMSERRATAAQALKWSQEDM